MQRPRRSDAADSLDFRANPIAQKYDDPVIHTVKEAQAFIKDLHEEYYLQRGIKWTATLSGEDVVLASSVCTIGLIPPPGKNFIVAWIKGAG